MFPTFSRPNPLPANTALRPERPDRLIPNPKARLKEQFHEVCRFKHVALRTEESYWAWVVRLVKYFNSHGRVSTRIVTLFTDPSTCLANFRNRFAT